MSSLVLLLVALLLVMVVAGDSTLGKQYFLTEPEDKVATRGERVLLHCQVEDKSGALQWTKDGFGLGHERGLPGYPRLRMVGRDPARDWHLQIDPVYLADEGEYQCQVLSRDSTQSIRSKAARLEVRAPCSRPIVAGPASVELKSGSVAHFECTCSGARPPARLQWEVGGRTFGAGNTTLTEEGNGPTWRTSSLLEFEVGKEQDGVEASCSVAGATADKKAKVTLGVTYPPVVEVVGAKEEDKLQAGGRALLHCKADARPQVTSWEWRLDGEKVKVEEERLVIERLDPKLQGAEVICWAENRVGRVNGSTRIFLHVPPKVSVPPMDIRAKSGTTVMMQCQVTGSPVPNITWFKVGREEELGDGASLQMVASEDTEGGYYCSASSALFPVASSPSAKLSIARAPRLIGPRTQYANLRDVEVRCSSEGGGNSSVIWTRGDSTVIIGGRFSVSETMETERAVFSLRVANATVVDFGLYTCTVQNDVGSSSLNVMLLEGVDVSGLQLGLGVAGILSCVLVLIVSVWFCRSLKKSAERAQEEGSGKSSERSDQLCESLELRQRRSLSPEPPDRPGPSVVSGPVLQTIRPDFAAFYGNPHLSSHLPQDEAEEDRGEEEEPLVHSVQFSALYGNPALSRQLEKESPSPPPLLPSPKEVYFRESPAQQHLEPKHSSTLSRPAAAAAAFVTSSEMGGDSIYSEPLIGYGDISYSTLDLQCGVEDDISTLAD